MALPNYYHILIATLYAMMAVGSAAEAPECVCAPHQLKFDLLLDNGLGSTNFCGTDDQAGITYTSCTFTVAKDGESLVVLNNDELQIAMVEKVDIKEFNYVGNVILSSTFDKPEIGGSFAYQTSAANLKTVFSLEEQAEDIPHEVKLTIVGTNPYGATITHEISMSYSHECGHHPFQSDIIVGSVQFVSIRCDFLIIFHLIYINYSPHSSLH